MSLRTRIIIIFLFLIFVSVTVFSAATVFLLKSTLWGEKTNENTMKKAADKVIEQLINRDAFNRKGAEIILENAKTNETVMDFDILSKDMNIIYSTSGKVGTYPTDKLIARLSDHGVWGQAEWAVAKVIRKSGELKGYLVVTVCGKNYQSISLSINKNDEGILGKIFILGFIITLIISCTFAFLLTINISRRLSNMFKKINSYELGNFEENINDSSEDEISRLANGINRMATKLKAQVERENALQEERRVFVSSMSHDLRTPLTSIVGYSESLENEVFENKEEYRRYARIIKKSALYMENLLGKLLVFLRFEYSNLELRKERCDVGELCREIIIEFIPILQEKEIVLEVEIPDLPVELSIDVSNFSRAFRNLIDNAVKYGSDGKYLKVGMQQYKNYLRIEVSDRGVGISNEHIGKIFDRFYREYKGRSTKYGGMGLGLSIAKDIIKSHDGDIKIESQVGQGTTVIIELPS